MKKSIEQIQREIHARDVHNQWIVKEGLYTPKSLNLGNDGPTKLHFSLAECLQFGACFGIITGFVGMFFELGMVSFIVGTIAAAGGLYALTEKAN